MLNISIRKLQTTCRFTYPILINLQHQQHKQHRRLKNAIWGSPREHQKTNKKVKFFRGLTKEGAQNCSLTTPFSYDNNTGCRAGLFAMVSLSTWFRYIAHKLEYSATLGWKNYQRGQITDRELGDAVWKNLFQGKLTYLHWNKGEEMAPSIGPQGGTLLVRKLPTADPRRVFVGDVVVLKDPDNPDNYLVRRLAAVEGYEMASTDEKDEPFVLEKDECWVLADNGSLKAKEANDSRKFGPVSMTDIVGRVIYCLRSAVDHGPVQNSHPSMRKDSPVLQIELDVDEMAKNHKA